MIFQHTWQEVLSGQKTQTRRLMKPSEWLDFGLVWRSAEVRGGKRVVWQVQRTYAVCPGRGKKAVGRISITDIRHERVQDITPVDAWAEIGDLDHNPLHEAYIVANQGNPLTGQFGEEYACYIYRWIWNHIHTKKGERWEDNPEVWVLEFELVEG